MNKDNLRYDLPSGWVKRAMIHFNLNSHNSLYQWLRLNKPTLFKYQKHLELIEFLEKDFRALNLPDEIVNKKIASLKKEYEG